MLQLFKTLLVLPLIATSLSKNLTEALRIVRLEVIEKNEGVIISGECRAINPCSDSCFLYLYLTIDDVTETLKRTYVVEMMNDETVYSDLIPYERISKKAKITCKVAPLKSIYESSEESIMYNPRHNAIKNHTIIEKNNNIPTDPGYYLENYDEDISKRYKHYDQLTTLNYEDIKVNDIYNCFNVSFLKFKYENGSDNALKGSFYFDIYDSYNIFTDFPSLEATMYKRIPLILNNDNNIYHFKFARNLYYSPNTHYPSYEYHQGYLETSLLYFPISYADKLKEIKCRFIFNINGYYDFNLAGEFSLRYIKKYFGDCSDSDYCISSNIDDGVNVYEKEVEVNI